MADFGFDDFDLARLRQRPGAKWQRPRQGLLPAWVADMDFPVAPPVREALQQLLDVGDLGYPGWPDATPLAEPFATRMHDRFGWPAEPSHVRQFTDIIQAVQVVLHLATRPGDGVALHTPTYPPFLETLASMQRPLIPIPMQRCDRGWEFDADRLARDVVRHNCRVLLLVNPHNPTGRVLTTEELHTLARIADEHDLLVIADEVHADLVYRRHRHRPFAALDTGAAERTVTLTSATKAFNLAGIRSAVAHVGPPRVRAALDACPDHLFGQVGNAGVVATLAAWRHGGPWLEGLLEYLDANRRRVAAAVADRLPGVDHVTPEGTYLAWLDWRPVRDRVRWDGEVRDYLRAHAGVELSPGRATGPGGDGFVRLNFATSATLLDEILDRLAAAATGSPAPRKQD